MKSLSAPIYGTLSGVPEEPELHPFRCFCFNLGPDAPILLLLWMFFAVSIYPVAMVKGVALGILAFAYTFVTSVVLLCLSWARGRAWRVFCALCVSASVVGVLLGVWIRIYSGRQEVNGFSVPSGTAAVLVTCAVLMALSIIMFVYQAFQITTRRSVVGSSGSFHLQHGWGCHAAVIEHMHFGCICRGPVNVRLQQEEVGGGQTPEERQVNHRLLRRQCYWSGEPALDYAFHAANNNLFFGCLFCHPVHPFGRRERWFVLLVVCALIVFPVAAFSLMVHNAMLRTVLQLVLVTVPRNLLKGYLLRITIEDSHIVDARLHGKRRWQEVVREKVFIHRHRTMHWSHRVGDTLRAAHAIYWEMFFCAAVLLVTVTICGVCTWYIVSQSQPLGQVLLASCDGLAWANVLELVFDLVMPGHSAQGDWQVGFFSRWWQERPQQERPQKEVH